jgi:hypothetical protein
MAMRKSISFAIAAFLVLCEIPAGLLAGGGAQHSRQDGREIERLRWVAPPGELPGTYEEYISAHPVARARFTFLGEWSALRDAEGDSRSPADLRSQEGSRTRGHAVPARSPLVSLLVDENLSPGIAQSVAEYRDRLRAEGYRVRIATVSGGTPEEIKEWIRGEHDTGSRGIILMGDIMAAWALVSGEEFPCDLFYMDTDGSWVDSDQDGIYDRHTSGTGDQSPEVYVARIDAATLTYDSEAAMVNAYLAKTLAYRDGSLMQPWRGLEYVEEDWFDMSVDLDLIYGNSVERHDFGYFTTAAGYLEEMAQGQHFVQVCAHSYSGGHYFSTRPTESAVYAHVYVGSPVAREARLLLGSDDGIKAWLNGTPVCTHDVYQGWQPDQFEHAVNLAEGWNRLLCKVSQGGGDFMFSARFTDEYGLPIEDLEYLVRNPQLHGPEGEYIRSWLVNGFHQDLPDNFWDYLTTDYLGIPEGSLDPREGEQQGGKTWTLLDSADPYIDLDSWAEQVDYGASYAFVRVYSASTVSCELWIGYDDGARVWLNGSPVLYDNRYGGYERDMTKVPVALLEGENRLLVKVSEWMGEHGMSARFCEPDGDRVEGLEYDPEPLPPDYIGEWLVNGPYANADEATRLEEDYLGGEAQIVPDEGDPAPFGSWEQAAGSGAPFDIAAYYDTGGGWVFSEDVQREDPPVLFYNLFACGPGRFTDENYLAGAYIFNTTWGIIAVASSKSGSMLNFQDFTHPLGTGKTLGQAFLEWFDAQAPFELWEREWYYGMVLCGDPELTVTFRTENP